jgi:hypothetical protein
MEQNTCIHYLFLECVDWGPKVDTYSQGTKTRHSFIPKNNYICFNYKVFLYVIDVQKDL